MSDPLFALLVVIGAIPVATLLGALTGYAAVLGAELADG